MGREVRLDWLQLRRGWKESAPPPVYRESACERETCYLYLGVCSGSRLSPPPPQVTCSA